MADARVPSGAGNAAGYTEVEFDHVAVNIGRPGEYEEVGPDDAVVLRCAGGRVAAGFRRDAYWYSPGCVALWSTAQLAAAATILLLARVGDCAESECDAAGSIAFWTLIIVAAMWMSHVYQSEWPFHALIGLGMGVCALVVVVEHVGAAIAVAGGVMFCLWLAPTVVEVYFCCCRRRRCCRR